jgi:protein-tyrosine kinase
MGRVYNALVKADRLTDSGRPIGRPAIADAQTRRGEEAQIETRSRNARTDAPAMPPLDSNAAFEFENSLASNETFAAPRNAEPFQAIPSARLLAVSAPSSPQPRKPAFEEPREVININSLSLDPHLVALTGSDALACERYRTLAVRICAIAARRKLKTLLVTSADEGEGKSVVAMNLAWMMAKRDNRRVLLIDASLRSPYSCSTLNIARARGWLEMTDASSEMVDAIIRLDPNGLYLMSPCSAHQKADLCNTTVDDALTSSQFEKSVAELTGYFDFIVIDGPSMCHSAGAQHLAAIADGTIVIARAGQTHHSRVTAALELAPQERRLGIVLNECEVGYKSANRNSGKRSVIKRLFGLGRARAAN